MRQFKFRAWNIAEKTMIESDAAMATIMAKHIKAGRGLQNGNGQELQAGEYEIMQFTGLKDKHGVEVYEGDILHIVYPLPSNQKGRMAAIFYREDSANFDTNFVEDFLRANFEIIGNIWQNPELVEVGG